MLAPLFSAILLACSLACGPLISSSTHAVTKSADGIRATLNWRQDVRWQRADDGGGRYKAVMLGPATIRITARGIAPQELSLAPFLASGHAYAPVAGPESGCGATTNLAILPKAGSPLPYVVVFTVLAEKGCLAVPIVFVPVRYGDRYAYAGAPYAAIWSSEATANARIRVSSVTVLRLPHARMGGPVTAWNVLIVTNASHIGPTVAALEPPYAPKIIRPGDTIALGGFLRVWFSQHAK